MNEQKSILKIIRKGCMFGLPFLLLLASLLHFEMISLFKLNSEMIHWFYTIALTANIGYFTNYIAIKMLFKPHYKTAFGRQGLIPKNQDKLADSLSKTLADNFLSSDQWFEYLKDSNLINNVLFKIKASSAEWLEKANNVEKITQWLINYCRKNEESINSSLNLIQQDLVNNFLSQLNAQKLLGKGFEWLEKQFDENPENMQQMIDPIIKTLAENIPEISHSLTQALDEHIEGQNTIKRNIAKMARWSTDFSDDDIKQYLFRMVASFEFRETLFNGLKSLINEYKNKPFLVNGSKLNLSKLISDFVNTQLDSINWVDLVAEKIEQPSKLKIDRALMMINQLDLRQMLKNKAATFSPQKMENIFQSMISEQLVFIELLGAVLGALSGLALINLKLFFILSALVFSFYLMDNALTKFKLRR